MDVNNLQVRDTNKRRVVNFLYKHDGASKQDIMSALGLSAPTVSLILGELTDRGLVRKSGTLASSGGRKPAANSLVYDARLAAGIELTLSHLRFVLIDMGENIVSAKSVRMPFRNSAQYFRDIASELERFLDGSGADRGKLLGVGVALPGVVDPKAGVMESSPTLGTVNLPLGIFEKYIPYAVTAGNEANLAGFTEIWSMDDTEDAVYLSVNKGVGGAIIFGNKLFCGLNGRAGEFGHMTLVKDGAPCSCGKNGCLEAYCSTRALTGEGFDDVADFFSALENGSTKCRETWERYLDFLAVGVNSLNMMFDTSVIIGGEISGYLEKDAENFKRRLTALSSFGTDAGYLHFSRFGRNAAAVGAGLLLVDGFLAK